MDSYLHSNNYNSQGTVFGLKMELLPGTTVKADFSGRNIAESILGPLFIADGLVLSQVSQLTGLEPYMVQNWVKRGYVSSPQSKKYSKRQFCRIIIINFLKDSFKLESIVKLLVYINNNMADESDDRVDDSFLYACFVEALSMLTLWDVDEMNVSAVIETVLSGFESEQVDARERVEQVLKIMLTAYSASRFKRSAETLLAEID